MFHSNLVTRTRNGGSTCNGFRTYIHSSIGPGREPLRRGILFITIGGAFMLVGGILTWLGFNDVFGGKASMTGPLLIALSVLLLLFSMRQFLIAKKRSITTRGRIQVSQFQPTGHGTVAALVIDRDDRIGALTVIMSNTGGDVSPDTSWRAYTSDFAPPSYNEVTAGLAANNSVYPPPPHSPSPAESEPPPTYDEALRSLNRMYPPNETDMPPGLDLDSMNNNNDDNNNPSMQNNHMTQNNNATGNG